MLNEGIITNSSATLIKSEMIRQLHELGPTTPDLWECSVFKALTGHDREEVDWSMKDNHAGYYTWIRSFDQLIEELIEDGYVRVEEHEEGRERTLVPVETDDPVDYSGLVYPGAK
jgi:hypothetical protein